MKCKYCGEEFIQANRGRPRDFCYREKCEQTNKMVLREKYYKANKEKRINGKKAEQKPIDIFGELSGAKIIYKYDGLNDYRMNSEDISELQGIGRELGAIRYKIVEMLRKAREFQATYDKIDQDFLHKIEEMDTITDEQAIQLVLENKKSREQRRCYKNKIAILQGLIDKLPQNPSEFVVKGIQLAKEAKYHPRMSGVQK